MTKRIVGLAVAVILAATTLCAQYPALSKITATIASGASVTGVINLRDRPVVAVEMPASWTTANLTVLASSDGETFKAVYVWDGTEYTLQAAASRIIVMAPQDFAWARYIKFRSGTSASPVNQAAERTLILFTRGNQ